jgi:hypothetical protein
VNPGKLRDFSRLIDVTDGHIALQQAIFILCPSKALLCAAVEHASALFQHD